MQATIATAPWKLNHAVHPQKIVAMGDSIVYGFGDSVGGGWVERLRRNWMIPGSLGHALYNLGVRGDGIKQVAKRFECEFSTRGELRNRVPDLLILSIGVNDSARLNRPDGRNFTDFNQFQDELANLLEIARSYCPVLFVGMVPVNEAKMPFVDCLYYTHEDQFRYKEATRQACLECQIPYLDTFSLWCDRGLDWCNAHLLEDGLHPNVAGYQALLDDVLAWEPFLEQVGASSRP